MTNYELSRNFFAWSFENPELISPNHVALYFFILEHQNRLGGKEKFGLPSQMAQDAIGIKSYKTYIKTLNDLIDWGAIKLVEKSRNQYSSNIVALVKFTKANTKALDKATSKHVQKQRQSNDESITSIDNSLTHQLNNSLTIKGNTPILKNDLINFKKILIEKLGAGADGLVEDFLKVRKTKRAPLTATALAGIEREALKAGVTLKTAIEVCCERSWIGFKAEWYDNSKKNFVGGVLVPKIGKLQANIEAADRAGENIKQRLGL